jgi:hypothetical protein
MITYGSHHVSHLGATGSHKPHYDVLHAAMFAEGRGGTLAAWLQRGVAPFWRAMVYYMAHI